VPVNLASLQAYAWRRLPLGKYMVGRQTTDDLVQLAVENWEAEYLNHARDDESRQAVCLSMLASVKRGHQLASGKEPQEYGFIWTFLLQMLAGAVIQILLKWWQERASNRVWMVTMKAELTR
jgi:hypothetical protein